MGCRQTVCHRRFFLSPRLRSKITHPLPGLGALTEADGREPMEELGKEGATGVT